MRIGVFAKGAGGQQPPSFEKIRAKRHKFGQNYQISGQNFDGFFYFFEVKKIFFDDIFF